MFGDGPHTGKTLAVLLRTSPREARQSSPVAGLLKNVSSRNTKKTFGVVRPNIELTKETFYQIHQQKSVKSNM